MKNGSENVFDQISDRYRRLSLVQQAAAAKLLGLLDLSAHDDVLDLGCGPGRTTWDISRLTRGRIKGVDISGAMIAQARSAYPALEFSQGAADSLDVSAEFDVVFCNSAFQWFRPMEPSVRAIHRALRPGGRFGMAGPGTEHWAPWMQEIIAAVTRRDDIRPIFAHWRSPWNFLPAAADYAALFSRNGFTTRHLEVVHESRDYSVEEAYGIYLSGAANGFTREIFYDVAIGVDYIRIFNGLVREGIEQSARAGKVMVDFNRLYYVGRT